MNDLSSAMQANTPKRAKAKGGKQHQQTMIEIWHDAHNVEDLLAVYVCVSVNASPMVNRKSKLSERGR